MTFQCFVQCDIVGVFNRQWQINGKSSQTIYSHLCPGLSPTVSKQQILQICWQGQTAYTAFRQQQKKKEKETEKKGKKKSKQNNNKKKNIFTSHQPLGVWPPHSIWITCSLLKGPSPGRSGGGDTLNEDEYSAALERLLEGCPACTRCSSQIGGSVREGGTLRTGLKRGSLAVGASGDD